MSFWASVYQITKYALSISNQYITFRIMLQEVTNIKSGKYITQT